MSLLSRQTAGPVMQKSHWQRGCGIGVAGGSLCGVLGATVVGIIETVETRASVMQIQWDTHSGTMREAGQARYKDMKPFSGNSLAAQSITKLVHG
jgi:hypothetical protein